VALAHAQLVHADTAHVAEVRGGVGGIHLAEKHPPKSHVALADPLGNRAHGHLHDSIAIADGDAFYRQIAGINRFICDQGPLTPDFIPSFRSVFLDLYEQHQTKSAS